MNHNQQARYNKIYNEEIYLVNTKFEVTSVAKSWQFTIAGSTKNIYKVALDTDSKRISCDCPDSTSWARRTNSVCKHCCFVMYRVIKYFRYNVDTATVWSYDKPIDTFFDNLIFTDTALATIGKLIEKINMKSSDYTSNYLTEKYNRLNKQSDNTVLTDLKLSIFDALGNDKSIDAADECSICFNNFESDKSLLLSCPTCYNYIHKNCMLKWLESQSTCLFCRSDVWMKYGTENKSVDNNKKDKDDYMGKYMNLND
ncbi:MAG: hypothetical protein Faunusvirus3_18 [Faunusvirus sp.]|jgi:hypothetical protein|uniref:RING-type domain-containing protein n=1 Tax=Faunusvirus sp. TaxID=2487766 RepID=A0A3G4ZW63_9VIRU|nr:MAG: hypothetical protein Faunusvirus3_18 [Faunusvirus sp.]